MREARAEAFVEMLPATLAMIVDGSHPQGATCSPARIAGIQAAKRTGADPAVATADAEQGRSAAGGANAAQPGAHRNCCRLTGKTGVEMGADRLPRWRH
ncbi:hypothetical protein M8494_19375 [Serratia ureilytica]